VYDLLFGVLLTTLLSALIAYSVSKLIIDTLFRQLSSILDNHLDGIEAIVKAHQKLMEERAYDEESPLNQPNTFWH